MFYCCIWILVSVLFFPFFIMFWYIYYYQHLSLNMHSQTKICYTSNLFFPFCRTKETLATGNFMSVINILMQLRKVCNHPNMFEERPTISSFLMEGIVYKTASLVHNALQFDPTKVSISVITNIYLTFHNIKCFVHINFQLLYMNICITNFTYQYNFFSSRK